MSMMDLFRLDGQVALVTGGSRGLGLQLAVGLGDAGCRIAIAARKADELAAAESLLRSRGIEAVGVICDLRQPTAIPALVESVIQRLGPIDVLVNNAGTIWSAPAEEHPDEGWYKVMQLNVDAPFFLAREVARRCMIPRGHGKIVNIGSVAGLKGTQAGVHTVAYNTSKAALLNLTRTLACEWGPYGIHVNALCPGLFPTQEEGRSVLGHVREQVRARTPLQRLGGDEDLKGAIIFFASKASSHVTGQVLVVDGGESAQ
ncbi:SDR family oxidoreductase [Simplicispira suum]|uniref:Gluconate 5-dehydrogenase n=1 Tax=Simplicispira suum TaxID=2109915 RepID=A0A2S0MYY6_9BURK|nr:SDR family oxidoreductase [Simplicispira suum]AVO41007.1 gluconate 5-dehydrogenase [Simplicispira suum]